MTHGSPPMFVETREHEPPRLGHPYTWSTGTACRRPVSVRGLAVSVVFPVVSSASEVFAGLPLVLPARLPVLEVFAGALPSPEVAPR